MSSSGWSVIPRFTSPLLPCPQAHTAMQHYGVNGYSLHAMNSLSAMYNLHQQAAQQAQHAPDYRPSVHALTLAERLAGKGHGDGTLGRELWGLGVEERSGGWGLWKLKIGGREHWEFTLGSYGRPRSLSNTERCQFKIYA